MVAQKKINFVQKIQDLLTKNQNFALVKIDKTTHQKLEDLRKELKKSGARFKVIKNSLFEKSFNKLASSRKNLADLAKSFFPMKETNALLILDQQWSNALSAFYQFTKKEPSLSFKFGLLDEKTYGNEELLQIAQLPGKEILVGKIIYAFNSPASRFVHSLKFNLTKLVYILRVNSNKTN